MVRRMADADNEVSVFAKEAAKRDGASNASKQDGGEAPKRKTLIDRVRSLTKSPASSRNASSNGEDTGSEAGSEPGSQRQSVRKTLSARVGMRKSQPKPEPEPDLSQMTPEEVEAYKVRKIMMEMEKLKREQAEAERERERLEKEVMQLTEMRMKEKDAGGYLLDGTDSQASINTFDNPAFKQAAASKMSPFKER